jgi:hypothetical protein
MANEDIKWDDDITWDDAKPKETTQTLLAKGAAATAVAGAAGAVGIGISKGVEALKGGRDNVLKVINMKKGAGFAESIRASFVQAHSDKVATFGNQIDQLSAKYPTTSVSLQTVVDDLNNNWAELNPEVKSVIKKTPYLRDMVGAKPKMSPELPLAKSQEVINYMNTKVPKNIRFNNLEVIDTINNVRGSQLQAFPEMEGVRADYKTFIEPYNQVKSQFKFGKLLNAIKNKFGGAEGQVAVEKILPKNVIKRMGGYRAAAKAMEIPSSLPFVGKTLKTVGGMFGYAPMALQAF